MYVCTQRKHARRMKKNEEATERGGGVSTLALQNKTIILGYKLFHTAFV